MLEGAWVDDKRSAGGRREPFIARAHSTGTKGLLQTRDVTAAVDRVKLCPPSRTYVPDRRAHQHVWQAGEYRDEKSRARLIEPPPGRHK
jgi:hypothetical protein